MLLAGDKRYSELLDIENGLRSLKRNSFSCSAIDQLINIANDESSDFTVEMYKNNVFRYLYNYKYLTIHAIDEHESPVSFSLLDKIYENTIFILQYFYLKNAYVVTIYKNDEKSNNFQKFFDKAFGNYQSYETFFDFGFIKCAMTMNKEYGIQNLLEIFWNNYLECVRHNATISNIRFMISIQHIGLSTMTIYEDEKISIYGKTKLLNISDSKIRNVINELPYHLSCKSLV